MDPTEAKIKEDNPCAQNDTKSQELSRNITGDDWVISIKNYNEGTTYKPRVERVLSMLRGIESNKKKFDPLIVSIGPYHHNDTKSQELSRNITRDDWVTSIKKYNEGTTNKSRVERVPTMLRGIESNKKCFDPLIVSIGPYHHNKPELQAFEMLKLKYAKQFVNDCGDQVSIEKLIAEVAKVVDNARECYEECSTEEYDKESFIRMMFLDGCFVLHFMCMVTMAEKKPARMAGTGTKKKLSRIAGTWTNKKPATTASTRTKKIPAITAWDMKISDAYFVLRDLFLLENQIPSLILQVLMKFRFESEETNLIQSFLNKLYNILYIIPPRQTSWSLDGRPQSPHLLDLVREHLIGPKPKSRQRDKSRRRDMTHIQKESDHRYSFRSDITHIQKESDHIQKDSDHWHSFRSVTELESAGIHFRASKTHHVREVDFKPHRIYGGTLMLPPIMVDDSTKPLLLNLVAYEMSPNGPKDSHISSYIGLMDTLIDHADDVKELRKQGILLNRLGSDEQLAQLFNEIADGVVTNPFAYEEIMWEIEKQCKNKSQVWIAEWMHNHFSSPWTVLALLGALLVLALTIVQTYVAINPRG